MPRNAQDIPARSGIVTGAAASILAHASLLAWLAVMPGSWSERPHGENTMEMVLFSSLPGNGGGSVPHTVSTGAASRVLPQNGSLQGASVSADSASAAPHPAGTQRRPPAREKVRAYNGSSAAAPLRSRLPAEPAGSAQQRTPASDAPVAPEGAGAGQDAGGGAGGGAGGDPVSAVFGGIDGPSFIRYAAPSYPEQARRLGKTGAVRIRIRLDASGRLEGAEVLESPHGSLARAALRSVRNALYRPLKKGGVPRPCTAVLTIRFELE